MSERVETARQINVAKDIEIEDFRKRAWQLKNPRDRWVCLRLIEKVERDLRFNVEAEGKK